MAKSDSELPRVPYDEGGENWLRELRLRRLRARGWQGTLREWMEAKNANGGVDPLTLDPPVER